ncbi:MAG: RHS repeat-associated core domain-containing protein [Coriobacteriia bacterium]|nr:RHS repeat-associated core domain-containing protein [Coriobacteriia bacterium]
MVTPGNQTSSVAFDDATHTYAVGSVGRSGVAVTGAYDARGRSTSTGVIPREESETVLLARTYDELDRLSTVTVSPASALGIMASFSYTDAGRLTEVTDPLDRTRTIDYDGAGRVTGTTSALGIRAAVVYDALGRVERTLAPALGAEATVTASSVAYDGLGRVESTTYHDTSGTPYATITPAYDVASRVTGTTLTGQVNGDIELAYDDLDRVTTSISNGPAGTARADIIYNTASQPTRTTYNAFDNMWIVRATYAKTMEQRTLTASDVTWNFGYGEGGALTTAVSNTSLLTRSFDVSGRLTVLRGGRKEFGTFYGLYSSRLSYDSRDRISGVAYAGDYGHTYADTYTYDPAGRLATWTRTGTDATTATYAWDAACNLTSTTQGGTTTTFVSDADDRLTTATTSSNVTTYTHDLYGRRTSAASADSTATYTWNPLGQLTSVATPQATATYSYGISGMREKAVVTQGGTTRTTESVWDGMRLAAERDGDGTLYRCIYAPDGTPLALTKGYGESAVTYAYHCDAQGSVVALTNPAGTVVARYRYDAFGRVTHADGADAALTARNPLRYRAYHNDAATGLYYLPARYYDPATARFLSPDPAPPSAGDPLSLNAYAYCVGDPVNSWDPTGAVTDGEAGAWDHSLSQSLRPATMKN